MPFILLDKKVSWLSGRNFFDDEKEVCRRNKKEKKIIDDEGTEFLYLKKPTLVGKKKKRFEELPSFSTNHILLLLWPINFIEIYQVKSHFIPILSPYYTCFWM